MDRIVAMVHVIHNHNAPDPPVPKKRGKAREEGKKYLGEPGPLR